MDYTDNNTIQDRALTFITEPNSSSCNTQKNCAGWGTRQRTKNIWPVSNFSIRLDVNIPDWSRCVRITYPCRPLLASSRSQRVSYDALIAVTTEHHQIRARLKGSDLFWRNKSRQFLKLRSIGVCSCCLILIFSDNNELHLTGFTDNLLLMKKIKRGVCASAGGVGRLPIAMVGDSIPGSSLGKIRWASDAATSTICMCVWFGEYNL